MRNIAEASNQNPSRNVILNMFMGWPNSLSHLSSQWIALHRTNVYTRCYRYFCKLENKNLHMHNLTAMPASKSNSPSLFENVIRQIASHEPLQTDPMGELQCISVRLNLLIFHLIHLVQLHDKRNRWNCPHRWQQCGGLKWRKRHLLT